MRARVAATAAAMLLVVGCASSGASQTVRPTLHLASLAVPVSGESPLPEDASVPPDGSGPPAGLDSVPPVPIPLPPSPSGSFPDSAERQLITHLVPDVGKTCARAGPFYPGELASISCGDGTKIPFAYYTLFDSQPEMVAGYAGDLAQAIQKPDATDKCTSGRYEHEYTIRAQVSGRIWCGMGDSGGSPYKLIEWTRDSLFVIGLINSYDLSWEMIERYWRAGGGLNG